MSPSSLPKYSILCWGWGLSEAYSCVLVMTIRMPRKSLIPYFAASVPHPYSCWGCRGLVNDWMEACWISTLSRGNWDAETPCVVMPPWHENKSFYVQSFDLSILWVDSSEPITRMTQSQLLLDGQNALTGCDCYQWVIIMCVIIVSNPILQLLYCWNEWKPSVQLVHVYGFKLQVY